MKKLWIGLVVAAGMLLIYVNAFASISAFWNNGVLIVSTTDTVGMNMILLDGADTGKYVGSTSPAQSFSVPADEKVHLVTTIAHFGASGGIAPFFAGPPDSQTDNLTYTITDDGVLTISGMGELRSIAWAGNGELQRVVIEEGVTSIGDYAFCNCSSLTSVTIPESVTSVGDGAFYGCSDLTSVNIPDSVTSIGESAFRDCSSLTSVTIPESVTSIGDGTFYGCSSLTDFFVSNGNIAYASINGVLFSKDGKNLIAFPPGRSTYTVPSGVTSIGDYAFFGCSSLTSITISNSVTSIGDYAFCNCSSLTSVTIPDSVTSIGSYAFEDCSSLEEVHISSLEAWLSISFSNYCSNPTYYAHHLFLGNTELTNVVIPDGVTSIGNYAFHNCSSLTSVTIPDSVTSIGEYAFSGCSSLEEVHISSLEAWLSISFGSSSNNPTYYAHHLFLGDTELTDVVIPDSVTSIGNYAFFGCSGLTSITIPGSVTSIGSSAFSGCSGLTSITIPDGVTSIGSYTFYNCSSLTSIVIPDSVTSIGSDAFYNCDGLTSITIPDSVTSIGSYAFEDCSSLEEVHISSLEAWLSISFSNYCSNPTYYAHHLFLGNTELTNVVIPDGVTSIGSYTFYNCSSLTSVTIPDSVTSIGDYAFYNCNSLTNINIPNSVTSIGDYAFYYCSSLTSIIIPDSVTSIGNNAFYNCSVVWYAAIGSDNAMALGKEGYSFRDEDYPKIDLRYYYNNNTVSCLSVADADNDIENAVIPDGVTNIGDYAFQDCSSLTSITIPDSVTSISYNAFYNCSSLTSVTIPDSVANIGDYAFQDCSSLTSITIPDSVTSIGNYAFYNCSSLEEVHISSLETWLSISFSNYCSNPTYYAHHLFLGNTELTNVVIPDSVTSIGSYTFYNCSSLTSITIPDSVTSIGNYAFYNCSSLTSVTIPDSVTSIDSDAFDNYSAIRYANVGSDGAKALGNAGYSFRDEDYPKIVFQYYYSNDNLSDFRVIDADSDIENAVIPNSVTSIGDYAFQYCNSLTSIILPDSLTSIGSYAFFDCYHLPSISLPAGVTSVGEWAFYSSSISRISIAGDSVNFGSYVFSGKPTVYCYAGTAVDEYFTDRGYTVKYLDAEGIDNIRTVTMPISSVRLPRGRSRSIGAAVFPNDDHPAITWTSSDPTVVSVEDGVATAHGLGTATITAAVGQASASMNVTVYEAAVSFALYPAEAWLVTDDSLQLSVTDLMPADAEISLDWTSSDWDLATVNGRGFVTTRSPGDVTITATDTAVGLSASSVLHLFYPVKSISLSAPVNPIVLGRDSRLTAIVTTPGQTLENHLVTFSSSDENVITVEPDGTVHAVGEGEATVTCASQNGKTDAVTISVVISCGDHIPEAIPAVAPTCEGEGLAEGSRCLRCGAIIVPQEAVPALGHDWGDPVYEWSPDGRSVTASRVCLRDASHMETETVYTGVTVITSPTMTGNGLAGIDAPVFSNPAFSADAQGSVTLPALGTLDLLLLPAGTQAIKDEAFAGGAFEAVVIPGGCASIGSRAFAGCENLLYTKIPAGVTQIAPDAFEGCPNVIIDRSGE